MQPGRHAPEFVQTREEALGRSHDLVERQFPAVTALGDEILGDSQGRRERAALVLIPALEAGDVLEVACGQEPQHFELGVDPRLKLPEQLQRDALVDDERRVRLLRPHCANRGVLTGHVSALDMTEAEAPALGEDIGVSQQVAQQQKRTFGLLQRGVYTQARAGRDPAFRIIAVLAAAPGVQEQLVELVRAGGEPRLHECQEELLAERRGVHQLDARKPP